MAHSSTLRTPPIPVPISSVTSSMTATITTQNHPPVANAAVYTVKHDQTIDTNNGHPQIAILGTGLRQFASDPDGDPLYYFVFGKDNVTHGKLILSQNGNFTYTPNPGFVGSDSFIYNVRDQDNVIASAKATINVTNERPEAYDSNFTVSHDHVLTSNVLPGYSGDGDPIQTRLVGGPFYGNLSLAPDGTFTYVPGPG